MAGYFPIVVQIPVVAGLQQRQRWPDSELACIRRTKQRAGQSVAGGGRRTGRIGTLGVGPTEIKSAGGIIWRERVELAERDVVAGLAGGGAVQPRENRL